MTIQTQTVAYEVSGTAFESVAVWDDATTGPRPGVLIAPTFMNRTGFEQERAERLARAGFAALVIDIFGSFPADFEEAGRTMTALNNDRAELARRMTAALEQLRALDAVDGGRVAAIGFCFGGKCVLDLARTGADLAGIVTFHGIFDRPPFATAPRIEPKVLVLHGWADPLATPEAVLGFADEMDRAGADWELVAYGHTGHGFTNDGRPDMYRAEADHRSWARFEDFLGELFG